MLCIYFKKGYFITQLHINMIAHLVYMESKKVKDEKLINDYRSIFFVFSLTAD